MKENTGRTKKQRCMYIGDEAWKKLDELVAQTGMGRSLLLEQFIIELWQKKIDHPSGLKEIDDNE